MSVKKFRDPAKKYALTIEQYQIDEMKILCRVNPKVETGGILIGKYSKNLDCAIVKKIGGPPPDSSAGFSWLFRGVKGLKQTLEKVWLGERLHYLGEWHYHPYSSPEPSETDHRYMKSLKENPKVDCEAPILFIIGGDPADSNENVSVNVYTKDQGIIKLERAD